jgi:hypothetical protein
MSGRPATTPREFWLVAGAASLVALILYLPPIAHWQHIPGNESQFFRDIFVTGPFSFLEDPGTIFWQPQIEFGVPRFGNPLFESWYPPHLFTELIPVPLFGFLNWFVYTAGGIVGGYFLFRQLTDDRSTAFLAGAVLVLSGVFFNTAFIAQNPEKMLFGPWTLYLLVRGYREHRIDLYLGASCLHILHFLAAPAFVWFYLSAVIGFVLLALAVRDLRERSGGWLAGGLPEAVRAGALFFIPCGLVLLFLVAPIAEYAQFAVNRELSHKDYLRTGTMHPFDVLMAAFWFPDGLARGKQLYFFEHAAYLGWIPLFLAFVQLRRLTRRQIWLVVITAIVILMAATSREPVNFLIRALPIIGDIRHSSFWMIAWNLLMLALAVHAVDALGHTVSWRDAGRSAAILAGLTILGAIVLVVVWGIGPNPAFIRPFLVAGIVLLACHLAARRAVQRRTVIAVLVAVGLIDALSWAMSLTLPADRNREATIRYVEEFRGTAQPPTIDIGGHGKGRAFVYKSAGGECFYAMASARDTEWALTFTSLPLRRAWELSKTFGWTQTTACGRMGLRKAASDVLTPERLALARALDVRFHFVDGDADRAFAEALGFRYRTFDPYSGFHIYEDPQTLGRIGFYTAGEQVADLDGAVEALHAAPFEAGRLILEADIAGFPSGPAPAGDGALTNSGFRIASYAPDRIVVRGNAGAAGILVLRDMVYPGWTATVNGTPADILPANIIGRGVYLTPGDSEVIFAFRPSHSTVNGAISAASALALVVALLGTAMRHRRRPTGVSGQ